MEKARRRSLFNRSVALVNYICWEPPVQCGDLLSGFNRGWKLWIFSKNKMIVMFPIGMSTIGLMEPTSRSPSNALLPSILITSWPGCKTSSMMRHFSLQRSVCFLSVFSILSKLSFLCGVFYALLWLLLVLSSKNSNFHTFPECPMFRCVLTFYTSL